METATVKTQKMVFGGQTIAKIGSKTVFIPYALPDETVSINIVQHKNDYDNAQIINIIEASPYRKNPECKYYGACGGCNMMHIQSEYQKQLRLEMLKDSFISNKIDLDLLKIPVQIISGPDFNYRARFQLTDGGLCGKNTNTIAPIVQCLCAENVINQYLKDVPVKDRPSGRCQLFGSEKMTEVKVQLEDKSGEAGGNTVNKNINNKKYSKKLKIKENRYFAGTLLSPQNIVTVKLLDKELSFDIRGFFQSNLFVFEKVIQLILQELPGGMNVLDMYSGCGSISTFLADKYQNVILVEHNRDALVFAEKNLAGKKHTSYGLSGEKWVQSCAAFCPAFDAAVVDPPRSGMEKGVLHYFANSDIPLILYLSCNPSTQARDAAALIKAGYKIEKVWLLDFYPNTSHIESLIILRKV
jgi:23S rRNA (uracil1939-C5)-methyltransferase